MNEAQLTGWLAEQAPTTTPTTLLDRVAGIPRTAPAADPGAWVLPRWGRRIAVVGLLAATITAAVVGAQLVRPQPPTLPGNGLLVVATTEGPVVVDPIAGIQTALRAPTADAIEIPRTALWGSASVAFSPDGRRVAHWTSDALRILDLDSGADVRVPVAELVCRDLWACGIDWSPDGRSLVAIAADTRVRLIDVASGAVTTIEHVPGLGGVLRDPTWSPDGQSIAFAAGGSVVLLDLDTRAIRTLWTETGRDRLGPISLHWSPDGERIGFISSTDWDPHGWQVNLVAIDPDDPRDERIAYVGDCYCMTRAASFAWSPDGTLIAFVSPGYAYPRRARDPSSFYAGGLYVARSDGSGRRLIASDVDGVVAWQPAP
jgi:Tol biopolymer transport system component